MKKIKKIRLHDLSQAEMADKEQNILRGGAVYCISICLDAVCKCNEEGDGSGYFPTSDSSTNNASSIYEKDVSYATQSAPIK